MQDFSGEPTRTGIWVGLAAIAMLFAALTSALTCAKARRLIGITSSFPRFSGSTRWLLLPAASRWRWRGVGSPLLCAVSESNRSHADVWLELTMLLGLCLLSDSISHGCNLRSEGLYLPTNPNSSFFYVFTAVHVLHVLGGLGGLTRVMLKFRSARIRCAAAPSMPPSYYWHFMGMLWFTCCSFCG